MATDQLSFVSPAATSNSTTASPTTGFADNFDTFLQLLTTQLRNQDPLSPADASEFTNQLVQFSQVEQQIKTNSRMEELITANKHGAGAALVSYLDREVEIARDSAGFSGSELLFSYELPEDAAAATVLIYDESGKLAWSEELPATSAGRHDYSWSGELKDGGTASDGAYRFSVHAKDAAGEGIAVAVGVRTKVTGLDLSGSDPALITEAGIYSYADIARLTGI